MALHASIRQQLSTQLGAGADDQATLNNALRLLSKWRSVLIQNTLLQQQGTVVMQGPLAGLDFLQQSAEGCHIAKLLGCYEQPLQPFIEQASAQAYPTILNIGCAEGYYAVGMAKRMPNTRVLAYDLNSKAQPICRELATKNGVSDRVQVGGLFQLLTLRPTPASTSWYYATSRGRKKTCLILRQRQLSRAWISSLRATSA